MSNYLAWLPWPGWPDGRGISGRITVEWVAGSSWNQWPDGRGIRRLASGMTTEEILADYEDLERDDILAALSYAARLAHVKRLERLAA